MNNSPLTLIVNGQPLKSFNHNGSHFIVAPDSGDFEIGIAIASHEMPGMRTSNARVEMVVSVDGLSVLDGQPASIAKSGYVVTGALGWNLRIPGWKLDNQGAAKFYFKPTDASYSAAVGHGTSNVGVIGLAIFREKPSAHMAAISHGHHGGGILRSAGSRGIQPMSLSADASNNTRSGDIAADIGAGFGARTDFHTTTTTFDRGERVGIWTAYYRSRAWFKANGIVIPGEGGSLGSAFPADEAGCKPPAGWNG